MKKHAIIPIFIPHQGCPNDCVFCNQKTITARTEPVRPEDVKKILDTWLATLSDTRPETLEAAFFGGSFTGLPIARQSAYLAVAKEYKDSGRIDKIHISTRPDYIDNEILTNLKHYGVDIVELGVQSFDPEVLKLSKRGHSKEDIYTAVALLKKYGFEFGIQLMIGLPGDDIKKAEHSAICARNLKPSVARLYPVIVLEDTELADMYKSGTYRPFSESEAVKITRIMYEILSDGGINIIRVGLKSTDLIRSDSDLGGGYHPAFRQLVEGEIAKDRMLSQLKDLLDKSCTDSDSIYENFNTATKAGKKGTVIFSSNSKSFSNMIGHRACNKKWFESNFKELDFTYNVVNSLGDQTYCVLYLPFAGTIC